MALYCCICAYADEAPHRRTKAHTVIRGYAVCEEHAKAVTRGESWDAIVGDVRAQGAVKVAIERLEQERLRQAGKG